MQQRENESNRAFFKRKIGLSKTLFNVVRAYFPDDQFDTAVEKYRKLRKENKAKVRKLQQKKHEESRLWRLAHPRSKNKTQAKKPAKT